MENQSDYQRGSKSYRPWQGGFTLIELMIVIAIIGVLAAIAIPIFKNFKTQAHVTETVSDLRNFSTAFHTVALDEGEYPNDSHLVLPAGYGLEGYISVDHWMGETPLGGNYNWEGPNSYPYAGIAIQDPTVKPEILARLDHKLDDGDLATGTFRKTPNDRYTYILEE